MGLDLDTSITILLVCIMYVCMYGHTYSKSIDQPSKVSNPARGQLNRENKYLYLSVFVPENLVSRDGLGSPVPRQPTHLHTQAESGAYLRDSSRVSRRRPFLFLNRHMRSGQPQLYRVMQIEVRFIKYIFYSNLTFLLKRRILVVLGLDLGTMSST